MIVSWIVLLVIVGVGQAFKFGALGLHTSRTVPALAGKKILYPNLDTGSFKNLLRSGVTPSLNVLTLRNLAESASVDLQKCRLPDQSSSAGFVNFLFKSFSALDWVTCLASNDELAHFCCTEARELHGLGANFKEKYKNLKTKLVRYREVGNDTTCVIRPHHLWTYAKQHGALAIQYVGYDEELGQYLRIGDILLSKSDLVTFADKIKNLMNSQWQSKLPSFL